jgi:hypothetical protein
MGIKKLSPTAPRIASVAIPITAPLLSRSGPPLIYLQSLAHAALSEFPILARFNGLSHEQARKRFAQLDTEAMELYRARVAASSQPPADPGWSKCWACLYLY